MAQTLNNVLTIFRTAIGRRNQNDPDSSDTLLTRYVNDFIQLTMSDDVKLFEQFGTLSFTIDETTTDGVYTMNDLGAEFEFVNIGQNAFISILDPEDNSVSWNYLPIFQDPGEFYAIWGINNDEVLVRGYPTNLLYYGNKLVFRTLPEQAYLVNIYGYKQNPRFSSEGDPDIPFDRWVRYLAYGAALNYAQDYRYEDSQKGGIKAGYMRERKLLLTNSHNQIKVGRALPKF